MNADSSGSAQAAETKAEGKCSVLIVEDLADSRKMLAMLLKLEGHEARTAADGLAGLESLVSQPPDVALVDIGLPGIDGYEVARRARENPASAGVRLVAMTGRDDPEDRDMAVTAGFDNYLVKPVTLSELTRVLKPREGKS